MALHFYSLTVKNIKIQTPDCVSISFVIPEHLKKEFTFKQGQSITLKKVINGDELRRSYSICSSPLDNELRIAVKKVYNGSFSTYANTQLKAGDVLEVMPPSGKFHTDLLSTNKKNYVAFAAGSGITPVISIIKTTLAIEPLSTFTLVFGNRNHSSIIFKEELEALKDKYIQRFRLYHILSRERMEAVINYGRINEEKCMQLKKLINLKIVDEFFICGPEEMIFCVKDFLETQGTDKNKIHFELFNTPTKKRIKIYKPEIIKETDDSSIITVKLDGRSFNFKLDYNSNNILDAALAEGADLPFACKGGVCCTCKAKLIEGKIDMEVNYGLEPDEVAAGFILTCQSHPRTEKVVVDYDVK
ncbi:MAG: phenylacetate-CoA oxygenase/reductase subunit PaaK [Chitinophagaceae bacterium]|nr:phenylacetate-CoA oxygenase/reductase subunit PaaK [Chitinophagaceae bacterium]